MLDELLSKSCLLLCVRACACTCVSIRALVTTRIGCESSLFAGIPSGCGSTFHLHNACILRSYIVCIGSRADAPLLPRLSPFWHSPSLLLPPWPLQRANLHRLYRLPARQQARPVLYRLPTPMLIFHLHFSTNQVLRPEPPLTFTFVALWRINTNTSGAAAKGQEPI